MQKKKVNYEDVDKSKFNAVDIRKFREITLKSSNPKILTPQPSNRSFHFEESGDGNCTLVITNPTLFWSVSKSIFNPAWASCAFLLETAGVSMSCVSL